MMRSRTSSFLKMRRWADADVRSMSTYRYGFECWVSQIQSSYLILAWLRRDLATPIRFTVYSVLHGACVEKWTIGMEFQLEMSGKYMRNDALWNDTRIKWFWDVPMIIKEQNTILMICAWACSVNDNVNLMQCVICWLCSRTRMLSITNWTL